MSFGELITNIQKQNLACVAELPQTPHFCILLPHVALWINKLEVSVRQIIALAVLLESGLIEGHRRLATFCFLSEIRICTEVLVGMKWESEHPGLIVRVWISGKRS